MKEIVERGASNQITHVFLPDSASPTGAGKTGLTAASAGLAIVTICPGEDVPVAYLESAGKIAAIATIGTYVQPDPDMCGFGEIDAALLPGWYEIHFHDLRFVGEFDRRSLGGMVFGAAGVVPTPFAIQLSDRTRGVGSPLALPNRAAGATQGLPLLSALSSAVLGPQVNSTAASIASIAAAVAAALPAAITAAIVGPAKVYSPVRNQGRTVELAFDADLDENTGKLVFNYTATDLTSKATKFGVAIAGDLDGYLFEVSGTVVNGGDPDAQQVAFEVLASDVETLRDYYGRPDLVASVLAEMATGKWKLLLSTTELELIWTAVPHP